MTDPRPATGSQPQGTHCVAIVGCGFVADLYMPSLARHPQVTVLGAHDRDAARLAAFTTHWNLPGFDSVEALLRARPALVLNLTNPSSHAGITRQCWQAVSCCRQRY